MNNISFKSNIRILPEAQFIKQTACLSRQHSVDYPWTVNQTVFNTRAITRNILDCTAAGITDGLNVMLMHICPTRQENQNFGEIADYIKKNLKFMDNKYLQGFILGSKNVAESRNLFENFVNLFNELKIPTSYFKGVNCQNHVAYYSAADEWLISNPNIKPFTAPETNLKNSFEQTYISKYDHIV